jgi:sugar lactone lactonase YvrE
LDSQGNIAAAVSTSGALVNNENVAGMVLYYSPEFELAKEVALDFAPTALNFDSDGTLYVAGSGNMAKIGADGKVIQKSATPNLMDADDLRRQSQGETGSLSANR